MILSLPAKLSMNGGEECSRGTSSALEAPCAPLAGDETRIITRAACKHEDSLSDASFPRTFTRRNSFGEGSYWTRGGEKINVLKTVTIHPIFLSKNLLSNSDSARFNIFPQTKRSDFLPFNLPERFLPREERRRMGYQAGIYFNSSEERGSYELSTLMGVSLPRVSILLTFHLIQKTQWKSVVDFFCDSVIVSGGFYLRIVFMRNMYVSLSFSFLSFVQSSRNKFVH